MTKKVLNFGQAERNARLRDFEIKNKEFEQQHNEVSKEEVEKAMQTMAKATGKELYIGTKRGLQSKVKFAQLIQENILYLRQLNYLTTAEKNFLFDIVPNVGFLSNCIVDDIKLKSPTPLTQTEIANALGKKRQNINPIIKGLLDKGVLARAETGLEDNNVRAYSIFVNPNIIFSGDKDNVNETLKAMFKKVPKEMKKLPVKLF